MIDFCNFPFHEDDLEELSQLELDFVFQPIFDAENLSIAAYEALMRPKGKTPLELIDEYQKKGKLYVIEIATCFGATIEYLKRGYTQDICINSFPSEFMNRGQMDLYFECFPQMGNRIIVEMLEYTDLNQYRWDVKRIEIENRSMKIAIDDFSTGNNDMVAVDYFAPRYVKLDRKLIVNLHSDIAKQEEIDRLVLQFHKRGIKVVAEGIETVEELEYVRKNTKIDFLQGYYLAMPQ